MFVRPGSVRYEFIAGNTYKGRPMLEVNATTGVLSAAQDLYYVRGMRNYTLTLRIFNNNTDSIKGPQNAEQLVNITLIILPVDNPPIVRGLSVQFWHLWATDFRCTCRFAAHIRVQFHVLRKHTVQ